MLIIMETNQLWEILSNMVLPKSEEGNLASRICDYYIVLTEDSGELIVKYKCCYT